MLVFSCLSNLFNNNFRNNNERKEKAKNAARDRRTQESDYFEVRKAPTTIIICDMIGNL